MTELQENRHTLRKIIKVLQGLVDDPNVEIDHIDLDIAKETGALLNGSPPTSGLIQHVLTLRTKQKTQLRITPA